MEAFKEELWLFFNIIIGVVLAIGLALLPTFLLAFLLSLDGL